MKFIHPETNKEYNESFIAFVVTSDRQTEHNPSLFSVIVCLHMDYSIAKAEFDREVERQKAANNDWSKSVKMVYYTRHGFFGEGLVVHKWTNY